MRISDWSSDVCLPIYSFLLYAHPVSEGMRTYLRDQGMTDEDHDWFMTQPVPRRAILGVDYYEWNEKLVDIAGRVQSLDRKSVVSGKSVSVRLDHGGRRIIKKKKHQRI